MKQTPARRLVHLCIEKGFTVTTAESCTGGLISKQITDIPGSSAVLSGAFVTYTNRMKMRMLGVDPAIIKEHTEVSYACAEAMAKGALQAAEASIAVATTGYAGPGGGTPADPVGTVYIAVATDHFVYSERFQSPVLGRAEVRKAAAARALELALNVLEQGKGSREK